MAQTGELTSQQRVTPVSRPKTAELSLGVRILRAACLGLILALIGRFLWGGTIEGRLVTLLAFAPGAVNPIWGLYGLALFGPFYLVDPGSTYMLYVIDSLALGAIFGELRLAGRGSLPVLELTPGRVDPWTTAGAQSAIRVDWGLWPVLPVCFLLLLLGSVIPGLLLTVFRETDPWRSDWAYNLTSQAIWGPATIPEWALRSLMNWTIGLSLAVVAARRATPLRVARFMKLGGAALLIACALGLFESVGFLSLAELRRPNPDPLHAGRFQGTAGHAGWMGQWIVIMWPGLLLWWDDGGKLRKAAIGFALAVVALALLLTAARAAWLGTAVALVAGGLFLYRRRPNLPSLLLGVVIGLGGVLLLAFALGGEILIRRLETLLRFTDRINYYVSGLTLLREYPLGTGLGTHFLYYEHWFSPYFWHYQTDHVTCHSLWLHLLVENGIFVPMLLAGGILFLLFEVRRAWPQFNPGLKGLMVVVWMALGGLLVDAVAQYVFYLRAVEYAFWALAGFSLGLCRSEARDPGAPGRRWGGAALLLAAGLVAVWMAAASIDRPVVEEYPRRWDPVPGAEPHAYSRWTGKVLRFPVDPEARGVSFSLLRPWTPGTARIEWPDGSSETHRMSPGQVLTFDRDLEAREHVGILEAPRWIRIQVDSTMTPARWDPFMSPRKDHRSLGVYVNEFRLRY